MKLLENSQRRVDSPQPEPTLDYSLLFLDGALPQLLLQQLCLWAPAATKKTKVAGRSSVRAILNRRRWEDGGSREKSDWRCDDEQLQMHENLVVISGGARLAEPCQ